MRKTAIAAIAMLATLSAAAQPPPQTSAPAGLDSDGYHHLLTENGLARVWLVEIPPHVATSMDRHDHDYLVISLADNRVTTTREDGASLTTNSPLGEARFVKGGFAHSMKNEAETPYRAITVEIMKSSTEPGVLATPSRENQPVILEREGFHAVSVQLKPDAELQARGSKNPLLLVPVTALELSDKRNDRLRRISLQPGTVEWLPENTDHKLKNSDTKAARFLVISFP